MGVKVTANIAWYNDASSLKGAQKRLSPHQFPSKYMLSLYMHIFEFLAAQDKYTEFTREYVVLNYCICSFY